MNGVNSKNTWRHGGGGGRPERMSEWLLPLSRGSPPSAEPPPPLLLRFRLPPPQATLSACAHRLRYGDPQPQRRGERLGPRHLRLAARSAGAGRCGPGKPGGAGGDRRVPARALRHTGWRGGCVARCGVGASGQPGGGGLRVAGEGGDGALADSCGRGGPAGQFGKDPARRGWGLCPERPFSKLGVCR